MKSAKKLLTTLLILVTVFTMSTAAFAEDVTVGTGNGSITVTNTTIGESYTLYKIFDATITEDGSGIVYTTDKPDLGEGEKWFSLRKVGDNLYEVTQTEELTDEAIRSEEFKKWALSYGVTPVQTIKAKESTLRYYKLAYGYYFLTSTRNNGPAITIDSANPHADVIDKNDEPGEPDKSIILNKGKSSERSVKFTTAEMNENKPVDYKLKIRSANYNKENRVWEYYIADVLPPGMTYKAGTFKVMVGEEEIKLEEANPKHYTITYYTDKQESVKRIDDLKTETKDISKATSFKISIPWTGDNPKTEDVDEAGKAKGIPLYDNGSELSVTYQAYLDPNKSDYINTDGRPNENIMKWGFKDDPDDRDIPYEGPDDYARVYQTRLLVYKFTGNNRPLTGAEFTLQRLDGRSTTATVIRTTGARYVPDANGSYWLLNNGKYTTVSPYDEDVEESLYASTTRKYKLEPFTEVQNEDQANPDVIKAYVDENGVVTFSGLYEGEYKLIESVVPDGYSKANDIIFTVSFDEEKMIFESDNRSVFREAGEEEGTYGLRVEVENIPGNRLPYTGGVGATIIYIIGASLVLVAGILLATRRRNNVQGARGAK